MEFHERLKQLRKSMNYTQEYLAKLLGITSGAIGLYEQNRREPDNDTVKQLAAIFNVSIDYLLGVDDIANKQSDCPKIIAHYNGACREHEITLDDFSYAMHNEMQNLTREQKEALLNMAKTLRDSNKK